MSHYKYSFKISSEKFIMTRPSIINRFFFEVKYDPEFTIVSIIQIIYQMDILILYAGLETVGPFVILFACGYLKVIQRRFEEISKSVETDSHSLASLSYADIRNCIIFHQKILKYVIFFFCNIQIFLSRLYIY